MNTNNLMILIIALLIIGITWWFTEEEQAEKKKSYIEDLYSFGTLNILTEAGYLGCTDPEAQNYSPEATLNSQDCIYNAGCCDVEATNYDPAADSCHLPNNNAVACMYGAISEGSEVGYSSGCTNSSAENYDPTVNVDDGSCACPCIPHTSWNCNSFWQRLFNDDCCMSSGQTTKPC